MTSDTPEIRPALTREEAARWVAALREGARYVRAACEGEGDHYRTTPAYHPSGEWIEGTVEHPPGDETADKLEEIAEKLAALLPPKEDTP